MNSCFLRSRRQHEKELITDSNNISVEYRQMGNGRKARGKVEVRVPVSPVHTGKPRSIPCTESSQG